MHRFVEQFVLRLATGLNIRMIRKDRNILHLIVRSLDRLHQPFGFVAGDESAVDADRLSLTAGQKEHVAPAQQPLGSVQIQDRARIGLGGHLKSDTRREIRLDHPGYHVHRRTLSGQNDVDAHRPRLLGQTHQRGLHVNRSRQHQIGELIDDDHDAGHRRLWFYAVLLVLLIEPFELAVVVGQIADP